MNSRIRLGILCGSLLWLQGCEQSKWETYEMAGRLQLEKAKTNPIRDKKIHLALAEKLFLAAIDEPEERECLYSQDKGVQRECVIYFPTMKDKDLRLASSFSILAMEHDVDCQDMEAEVNYRRALAILETAKKTNAGIMHNLGNFYSRQGRYAEAEPLLRRVFEISERKLDGRDPILGNLAKVYREQGKYKEAEPLYLREINLMDKAPPDDLLHAWSGYTRAELAELYRRKGRYVEAERLFLEALAIMEKTGDPAYPDLATALENYAQALRSLHRDAEAEKQEMRAKIIRTKLRQRATEKASVLPPCWKDY